MFLLTNSVFGTVLVITCTPGYFLNCSPHIYLPHHYRRSCRRFHYVETGGEGVFQFVDMGYDQNLLKVVLYRVDGFLELLDAGVVLCPESFVDNQSR